MDSMQNWRIDVPKAEASRAAKAMTGRTRAD
jgi:hypothetical protein